MIRIIMPSIIALIVSIIYTSFAVSYPHAAQLAAAVIVGLVVCGLLVWSMLCTRRARRWPR